MIDELRPLCNFWPVLKTYVLPWMVGLCINGHICISQVVRGVSCSYLVNVGKQDFARDSSKCMYIHVCRRYAQTGAKCILTGYLIS